MKQFRMVVATLAVCFVIGIGLGEVLPQTVFAEGDPPPEPHGCNLSCYRYWCNPEEGCPEQCLECVKYYVEYQYEEVAGCDGPYGCWPHFSHCAVTCETSSQ